MESKEPFTVFCDVDSGGFRGWLAPGDETRALAEVIEWLSDRNYKPVAWTVGDVTGGDGNWQQGNPKYEGLRAESIAAGRTIELIAGKYIPRGVPGEPEKKEQNQFRVGGVYRDGKGRAIKLIENTANPKWAFAMYEVDGAFPNSPAWGDGARNLSDGRYVHDTGNGENDSIRLLPGELHQVNGEWVSVGGGSGCISDKPAEDETGWRVNGKAWTPTLDKLERSSSCAKRDSDENHRPALTWDKPVRIDRFPGFVVKSDSGAMVEADNSPYTRLGDTSNPLHGSAFLKG